MLQKSTVRSLGPFWGAGTVADWGIPAWPFDKLPPESPNRPLSLRRRSYVYALGLVLALPTAGTVAYWGILPRAYRMATPATELDAPARVGAPAQSAASGAAATTQQLTTPAQADIEAAVATAAQTESGQPNANVANRLAGVCCAQAGREHCRHRTRNNQHRTVRLPTSPWRRSPCRQRSERHAQAGTPPAAPLPADADGKGRRRHHRPRRRPNGETPQAAMPPAAPVRPAMPTPQGAGGGGIRH